MSDLTDEQRKIARRTMASFPGMIVKVERDGDTTRLIPYRSKSSMGDPVEIVNGVTQLGDISKALAASCRALAE